MILAVVVFLAAAVVTPVYWNVLASPERLRWTLVGAGSDGRSLRIITTAEGGSCDDDLPKAHLERDGPGEIRVRIVQHDPVGWDDALHPWRSYDCAGVGIGRTSFDIRLGRPLDGRRITGPGYRPRLATRVGVWNDDPGGRVVLGRVVGLRLEDARRVLRASGVAKTTVIGPVGNDAVVTRQLPAPGTALAQMPRTSKRTFNPDLTARLTVRNR